MSGPSKVRRLRPPEPEPPFDAGRHLETTAEILRRADRAASPVPWTYIAWGLVGPAYYAPWFKLFPAADATLAPSLGLLLAGAATALTVVEFARVGRDRVTYLDRQAFATFALVTTLLWSLKALWFGSGLIGGEAYAIVWSLGLAIPLIVLGLGGVRPLLAGGLVLVAAIVAGSFARTYLADILAAGNLLGIAGPGAWYLARRRTT
jgi:hypothetical protein